MTLNRDGALGAALFLDCLDVEGAGVLVALAPSRSESLLNEASGCDQRDPDLPGTVRCQPFPSGAPRAEQPHLLARKHRSPRGPLTTDA